MRYVDGASITVRIGDPRLFDSIGPADRIDTSELPNDKRYRTPGKSKPIRGALPKGIEPAMVPMFAKVGFRALFAS